MNNYLIMFAHATIVALVQRYRILSACDAFPYTIKFECAAGPSLASQTLYLTATLGKGLVKCMHQFRSLLQNLEERTSHV